ncbi:hypothetical protein KR222_000796, partial [Zaprionus bogoriensis]
SSSHAGLTMKPNRKYTQTIVKSFHISGVALDEGASAKFYITADQNKFIVATLNKNIPQVALDLNFCRGDKIMFQTTGDGTVSLIGYMHDAEDSDDEDYEDEEYAALAQTLGEEGQAEENGSDSEEGSDDDEDADDSKLAAEYSSFLEEEESGEEEEEEGDSGDEDEAEEEDSEEEDVSPKAKKAKISESAKKPTKEQNGVAKNDQKQQGKSKKDKKAAPEPKKEQAKPKEQPKQKEGKQQQAGGERTITGGVKVHDVHSGSGPEAKQGKRVSVYYIGRLKSNNKTFDSMQKGNGFKFALGAGEVIKGWDVGVVGMKVGGKRRITCPPHMAYGARGHPPTIPPNSTLVFDVELKAVH